MIENQSINSVSDTAALLESSKLLNSTLDLDFILGNILLSSMGKLLISRGMIFIRTSEWNYEVRTAKGILLSDHPKKFILTSFREKSFLVSEICDRLAEEEKSFADFCADHRLALLIPMILKDRMIGIIGLGQKFTKKPYSDEEMTFLESLAAIASSAVHNAFTIEQLKQSHRRLDHKIQELNTLFEFGREVNMTFDEKKILRLYSYALMGQFRIMQYAIFLKQDNTMHAELFKLPSLKKNKRMLTAMCKLRDAVQYSDHHPPESALDHWLYDYGLRVIIPMRSQNETRGILCLGEKPGGTELDASEMEYLSALANVAISALENARLVQETLEKQRLEKELSIARTIQRGLLPKQIPELDLYDVAAVNISSQQIGGDYYDVIALNDHEYAFAIGDVSGKGIPASLLMANVQAAIRVLAPLRLSMSETTSRINAIVHQNTSADAFITFFWGILDVRTHTFRYVNAGHNPPYLFHTDGTYEILEEGGIILGVLPMVPPYKEGEVMLQPGDCLILFTDGITEAMNEAGKEMNEEQFIKIIIPLLNESSSEIIERTHQAIKRYAGPAPQSDDITMMVMKVRETMT